MNVPTGGYIEILLADLLARDDARVLVYFLPRREGARNPDYSLVGEIVFRVAFYEVAASV